MSDFLFDCPSVRLPASTSQSFIFSDPNRPLRRKLPDQRSEVDDEHLIIRLDVNCLDERREIYVWEQVEDVLELVNDLMVDRQLLVHHLLQIVFDVFEAGDETLENDERGRRHSVHVINPITKSFCGHCERKYNRDDVILPSVPSTGW